jgi:hypothetical protein
VDSKIRSHSAYSVNPCGPPAKSFEKLAPYDRLDEGAYLIVISLLSLGIWAAIWGAVATFGSAVLG